MNSRTVITCWKQTVSTKNWETMSGRGGGRLRYPGSMSAGYPLPCDYPMMHVMWKHACENITFPQLLLRAVMKSTNLTSEFKLVQKRRRFETVVRSVPFTVKQRELEMKMFSGVKWMAKEWTKKCVILQMTDIGLSTRFYYFIRNFSREFVLQFCIRSHFLPTM